MKIVNYESNTIFRSTKEIDLVIKELLKRFPDKYQSKSQVIRSSVMQLWRKENENIWNRNRWWIKEGYDFM